MHDRYGVDPAKIQWLVQAKEVFPVHNETAKIEYVDDKKNMVERLIAGEIEALITDISDTKLFATLESHPKVRRLFPDYVAEDQKLYNETGVYTPVHMVVMSRKLDRERPELAAQFLRRLRASETDRL